MNSWRPGNASYTTHGHGTPHMVVVHRTWSWYTAHGRDTPHMVVVHGTWSWACSSSNALGEVSRHLLEFPRCRDRISREDIPRLEDQQVPDQKIKDAQVLLSPCSDHADLGEGKSRLLLRGWIATLTPHCKASPPLVWIQAI